MPYAWDNMARLKLLLEDHENKAKLLINYLERKRQHDAEIACFQLMKCDEEIMNWVEGWLAPRSK